MKKLILCMFLLGIVSAGHTQILLKEANVFSDAASMKLDPYTNSLTIQIPEIKVGEFSEDPLMFLKNHFNAPKFADANKDLNLSSYEVWFKTKKGYMVARFDTKGSLISSSQKFKNVILPQENRKEIIEEHGNVNVVDNKYFATSNGWVVNEAFYRVKIKDGKKTKRIRIDVPRKEASLAGY